ncbi:MAG: recombinase family protein [Hungatella sp.]|jgi:DNA invertase Pin-like site-specific DNA recombinase|nr:recombinase family protein [Hungatella sp.]
MNRKYIIVLYIRISVEDIDNHKNGKDESNSITNQRDLLRRYVESQPEFYGCEIIELCDDGFSGTNMNRPAMTKLLDMARAKQVDCIVVKDFSRFGRDYLTVSDYVDQIFPFLGIRFISLGDGYDSARMNGATSGVDIAFRNVIYSYYSKDLSMKVRSGKLTKAQKGKFLSSFAPIGYCKDKKNKNQLIIEEEGAAIVRRIFQMAGMGMSALQITRLLNAEKIPTPSELQNNQGHYHKWWSGIEGIQIWDPSMVTRILRDERYLGKAVYGKRYRPQVGYSKTLKVPKSDWVIIEQCHEPIVTEEEFLAAQQMMREYVEKEFQSCQIHLFTNKIRCGHCGYALTRRKTPDPCYFCETKKKVVGFSCMNGHIKESAISEVILSTIHSYIRVLLDEKNLLEKAAKGNKIVTLQKQIAVHRTASDIIDRQKAELYDQKACGKLTREQFLQKREALSREQETMEQEADRLEAELVNLKGRIDTMGQGESKLMQYLKTDELTRQMVEYFVDCIYVYNDKSIHVDWNFIEGVSNEQSQKSMDILQGCR